MRQCQVYNAISYAPPFSLLHLLGFREQPQRMEILHIYWLIRVLELFFFLFTAPCNHCFRLMGLRPLAPSTKTELSIYNRVGGRLLSLLKRNSLLWANLKTHFEKCSQQEPICQVAFLKKMASHQSENIELLTQVAALAD